MASKNETVEEVCGELKEVANGNNVSNDGLVVEISQEEIWGALDRIEAAHKREIAAKDAEIAKLNAKCKEYERQPELMAETAREALRTLQEQDAEIAELRQRIKEACDGPYMQIIHPVQ